MNGSALPPQLQPGFRQRLLPTPVGSVPTEYADALRAFCATVPEIETAYVCAVELMRELGCGVLADRAVPAWQEHALRVFGR